MADKYAPTTDANALFIYMSYVNNIVLVLRNINEYTDVYVQWINTTWIVKYSIVNIHSK